MDNLSEKSCTFIKNLMQLYLVENDYDALKNVLHSNITCIGSGIDELWNGFDDACTKIEILSRFDKINFIIEDDWYNAEILSPEHVIVHGEIQLKKNLPTGDSAYSRVRLSTVCQFKNETFTVMHMHFSLPINVTSANIQNLEKNIKQHRTQLADKVQELLDLTNGIRGGVEICSLENGYTIQYLSQGFTDLLGYSETDLESLIGTSHKELIHKDDYDFAVSSVAKQLEKGDTYAVEYRMVQKNGQYIWVLENGRIINDQDEKRLHCLVVDIHKQKIQEEELTLSKLRYELAIKATQVQMFEYDIATRNITLLQGHAQKFGIPNVLENAGESLIELGIVSPDSANALNEMFKKVSCGEPSAEGDILLQYDSEKFQNYNVRMTTGFSDTGKPLFAIGVIKNIQEIVELKQENFISRTMLLNRNIGSFEVNITRDEISKDSYEQYNVSKFKANNSYSKLLKTFLDTRIYEDDKHLYSKAMSLESLRAIADYDNTAISVQYRRLDENKNEYRWWSVSGRLVIDSHTNDVKAFFYEEDIDDIKEQELTLRYDAEHDKMTGFYNRSTGEESIQNYLKSTEKERAVHAFFLLDLDHFKDINDTFGHIYGDAVIIESAQKISNELRNSDIIARIGGDECCILMKEVTNIDEVKEKASQLCKKLCKTYTENNVSVTISASIGIALTSDHGYDFKKLYEMADEALYTSKHMGRNQYTIKKK